MGPPLAEVSRVSTYKNAGRGSRPTEHRRNQTAPIISLTITRTFRLSGVWCKVRFRAVSVLSVHYLENGIMMTTWGLSLQLPLRDYHYRLIVVMSTFI